MRLKRILCVLLLIGVLFAGNIVTSFADWYSDVKSGCTWVEIKGDEFVADTFCGVEALYSENGYYYQCNELIMRFYAEAYGLDVLAYSNTGLIMLSDGYAFVEATTPKKGDVIYVTAEMRNASSDHWAIVKDYSNGYITMFEQNVIWDGKAAVNRKIKYPSDSYYLLTPVSTGTASAPTLKGAEKEITVTETKPITTTVKAHETTKTTVAVTETTTRKAEKTVAVTTTTEVRTTEIRTTETTTETASTVAETTHGETAVSVSTTLFEYTQDYSRASAEEQSDNGRLKTGVFAALGILLVLIAAVVAVMIKKRK